MVASDPIPCKHGRYDCECWKDLPQFLVTINNSSGGARFEQGTDTAGWSYGDSATSGNISISPIISTFPASGTGAPLSPMLGTPDYNTLFQPPAASCTEHTIAPDSIREWDDGLVGHCEICAARILIPRVPGGVSFERAGTLVGRAMSLDDEEEAIGELLAELNLLEGNVKKEINRYKRTLGLVKIARDIVHNRAIQDSKVPVE